MDLGQNPEATTFVSGSGRQVFRYLSGRLDAAAAKRLGVSISGDRRSLDALISLRRAVGRAERRAVDSRARATYAREVR